MKTLLGCLPLDPAAAIPGAAGQVTVLIRPEQIDIVPNEDGLTAHVTSYRYHGHDAVLYVRPEDEPEGFGSEPVVVRIIGGSHRPVGPASLGGCRGDPARPRSRVRLAGRLASVSSRGAFAMACRN